MSAKTMTLESPLECLAFTEADATLPGLRTVKLSPWGKVESKSGEYQIDDEAARSILAAFHEHGTAVPIDREHETIAPPVGGARGAVGWVEQVYSEPGRAIFGLVRWTDAGRELIRSEAFRYISPVFMVNPKDRRAMILHSAAITNKPAIPRMERLAASEKLFTEQMAMADTTLDPRTLIEEMAKFLGVSVGDDPVATLAAIRDAIKSKMAENDAEPETKTVTNAQRVAPEMLAMREENQTLRIQLRRQELTEFLAPYVAKGVLSNDPKNPFRGRADYRQMMALAESNPDLAKAWLDERIEGLPKQVQLVDGRPLEHGTKNRGILIANAEREFDTTPGHQKATSKRAFVNLRLREANLVSLSEDESRGYETLVG